MFPSLITTSDMLSIHFQIVPLVFKPFCYVSSNRFFNKCKKKLLNYKSAPAFMFNNFYDFVCSLCILLGYEITHKMKMFLFLCSHFNKNFYLKLLKRGEPDSRSFFENRPPLNLSQSNNDWSWFTNESQYIGKNITSTGKSCQFKFLNYCLILVNLIKKYTGCFSKSRIKNFIRIIKIWVDHFNNLHTL